MIPPIISASSFYLGPIHLDHVDNTYVSWLKNPEVNKFLEVRHLAVTVDSQKVFVANIDKAKRLFNWEPTIKKEDGIEEMINWVKSNG